jgi:hypothetical protein
VLTERRLGPVVAVLATGTTTLRIKPERFGHGLDDRRLARTVLPNQEGERRVQLKPISNDLRDRGHIKRPRLCLFTGSGRATNEPFNDHTTILPP